jgi:hypothetical protein
VDARTSIALGTRTDPESAIKKAAKLEAADPRLAAVKDEQTWINESFEAAKMSAYVDLIGVGAGPFTVDAEYRKQARAVAAERVALAGSMAQRTRSARRILPAWRAWVLTGCLVARILQQILYQSRAALPK